MWIPYAFMLLTLLGACADPALGDARSGVLAQPLAIGVAYVRAETVGVWCDGRSCVAPDTCHFGTTAGCRSIHPGGATFECDDDADCQGRQCWANTRGTYRATFCLAPEAADPALHIARVCTGDAGCGGSEARCCLTQTNFGATSFGVCQAACGQCVFEPFGSCADVDLSHTDWRNLEAIHDMRFSHVALDGIIIDGLAWHANELDHVSMRGISAIGTDFGRFSAYDGVALFAGDLDLSASVLTASHWFAPVLDGAIMTNVSLRDALITIPGDGTCSFRQVAFDGANLEGLTLKGARGARCDFCGASWRGAICPDGARSDQVGGTCLGHFLDNARAICD